MKYKQIVKLQGNICHPFAISFNFSFCVPFAVLHTKMSFLAEKYSPHFEASIHKLVIVHWEFLMFLLHPLYSKQDFNSLPNYCVALDLFHFYLCTINTEMHFKTMWILNLLPSNLVVHPNKISRVTLSKNIWHYKFILRQKYLIKDAIS